MFCHNHEAITTLSPMPGQAALRGEWLLPPEGTARAEVFCAFHFIVELLVGCSCVSFIEGPGVTCKLARHRTAASILRYFRSMPQVVRWAAALGSRAAYPTSLKVIVESTSSQDTRHKLVASHLFGIILS